MLIHTGRSLIIPSAGFATRLYPLSQDVPKILVKMNGVPLLHWFYKKSLELDNIDNIIIAVNPEFERRLQEHIDDVYSDKPIYVVSVDDPDAGPMYSIYSAIKHDACANQCLIMLSDTIYTGDLKRDTGYVIYKQVPEPLNRWCLVETKRDSNTIKQFWDKPQGGCPTDKALIGIYSVFRDPFINSCKDVIEGYEKIRGEYQISQALEKYMEESDLIAVEAEPGAWQDTGVLKTLKETSNKFLVSRSFNTLELSKGVLVKKSINRDTLRNEYLWYTAVSKKNHSIVPEIYSYGESIDTAELRMEYCPLDDLGSIFDFCQSKEVFFTQTIEYLFALLYENFYRDRMNGRDKIIDANKYMLIDKLDNRMKQYRDRFELTESRISEFRKRLHVLCLRADLVSVIHGDLITSNILFDPQRMVVKFVDPRGSYGDFGICGDIRYDLAKLLHSLDGKYETIIHSLYRFRNGKLEYLMSQDKQRCFKAAENRLLELANGVLDIDKEDLKLIEADLYFSMIPLHSDDQVRQQALLSVAERILDEVL